MKDSVKKHSESLQHCETYKLQQKSDLRVIAYMENVVLNSPLGKIFLWLTEDEKDGLRVKFRTVYYNIKNENSCTGYPDLLNLQRLNGGPALQETKQANSYATADAGAVFDDYIRRYHMNELKSDLAKAKYYSILMDGSTDKVIVKQEAICMLFLHGGEPKLKYFSVKCIKSADAEGVLQSLRIAFERIQEI